MTSALTIRWMWCMIVESLYWPEDDNDIIASMIFDSLALEFVTRQSSTPSVGFSKGAWSEEIKKNSKQWRDNVDWREGIWWDEGGWHSGSSKWSVVDGIIEVGENERVELVEIHLIRKINTGVTTLQEEFICWEFWRGMRGWGRSLWWVCWVGWELCVNLIILNQVELFSRCFNTNRNVEKEMKRFIVEISNQDSILSFNFSSLIFLLLPLPPAAAAPAAAAATAATCLILILIEQSNIPISY